MKIYKAVRKTLIGTGSESWENMNKKKGNFIENDPTP